MMDKNGKVFGKINIIDLLVIVVIIAAAIGISARFITNAAKDAKSVTDFSYVVKIEGVRNYTVNALEKMGKVSNIKTGELIGEITNVKSEPQTRQQIDENGRVVNAEIPERYNVYVTVSAEGKDSEDGYFVGGDIELSVGTTMTMATKYVNSTGRVTEIEKIGE